MTEHKTTTAARTPGRQFPDWFLESGFPTEFPHARGAIRLAVAERDQDLTVESAAALRDALTAHLENLGYGAHLYAESVGRNAVVYHAEPAQIDALAVAHFLRDSHALRNFRGQRIQPPTVPDAYGLDPEIRDAYADNARTIGASETAEITDAEAARIVDTLQVGEPDGTGPWTDAQGIRYTSAAYRELKVKANRYRAVVLSERTPTPAQLEQLEADLKAVREEAALKSPVAKYGEREVMTSLVRSWSDEQCRGAWNHAMEAAMSDRLTDRPTGRRYTLLASRLLRKRLNQINAAPRG